MANCPRRHGLERFKTPVSGYGCDVCKKRVGRGTEMYGCRSCNYDLCRSCMLSKQGGKAQCPGGHGLASFKVPNNSFRCDNCSGKMPKGSAGHGCRTCNYDLCQNCMNKKSGNSKSVMSATSSSSSSSSSSSGGGANCPRKHGLKPFNTPVSGYGCDICKKRVGRSTEMYGCRSCNYDVCCSCMLSKQPKPQQTYVTPKAPSASVSQADEKSVAVAAASKDSSNEAFKNFGALGELLQIIASHVDFMKLQEKVVDDYIAKQASAELLAAAKKKALQTEERLMKEIMSIPKLNQFLNNIILIENLFNSFYTQEQRSIQKSARQKYAPSLKDFEQKAKPTCRVKTFVDLMFAGTNVHISSFAKFLKGVEEECKKQSIKIVSNSGAKGKSIERAFYKAFYVYALYGQDGFKQMTDVLRCSIVFDSFEDLYRCFSVIKRLAVTDNNGGILRVKDRYDPLKMPFGYRDMLINIFCPGSKLVCEIQLHHVLFYRHKKVSHTMYKRARLFEDQDTNLAYEYAAEHIRSIVGTAIYEVKCDDAEEHNHEHAEHEDVEELFRCHACEVTYCQLFTQWNLGKFCDAFVDEGYGEKDERIDLTVLVDLDDDDLKSIGLGKGHIKKFKNKLADLKKREDGYHDIVQRREEVKKRFKKRRRDAKANGTEGEDDEFVTMLAAQIQKDNDTNFNAAYTSLYGPGAK